MAILQSRQKSTDNYVELPAIRETTEEYEAIEKAIKELFKQEIYYPILAKLSAKKSILMNAASDSLLWAIKLGRIQFNQGSFSGKFSAGISRDLKELGAKWDRRTSTFKILKADLPMEVRNAISASESVFQRKLDDIDELLRKMLPEEIAGKLNIENHFDSTLWKVQRDFKKSVKNITIAPDLSDAARKRIAKEWQNNMELWIQEWTEKEIKKLRKEMKETVFAGNRFESAVGKIRKSYGVSENKARFLARQETNLLMAKFKQTRYEAAGVNEYKWGCVRMPHDKSPKQHTKGNVRYNHGILEGKIFRWDNPPVTSTNGDRNNPGQDYNCRCFARPIVKFK